MSVRLSADVGGTFTDVVVVAADGRIAARKVPSTPDGFECGVIDGARAALKAGGFTAEQVERVVHGTTAGTNAVLERTGPLVGLITTRGFRDVLEIGRLRTPRIYDLGWRKPAPLVRRRYRLEIEERMRFDGVALVPPWLDAVAGAVDRAVAEGVASFAVSFVNAHANNAHEEQVAAWLRDRHPSVAVTVGSRIVAEIGEFERTSTAVLNAYLLPVISSYLRRLLGALISTGISAPILVMQSNAGMLSLDEAAEVPVRVLESGPAAGVFAAARIAEQVGERHAVGFDMGGTTAKASLIEDYSVERASEFDIGSDISSSSRLLRGGGYTVRLPVVDLAEVGAGGGSIARVDGSGALRVGPDSAGAMPGPACYGRGGTLPTVTDANLVLGYLSIERLSSAGVDIDRGLAESAIAEHVAAPLGLSVGDAALAVHAVADQQMARVLRAVTTERGRELARHSLIVSGGSGGLHAASLAAAVGIDRVVVPPLAGVLSAVGMLWAPVQLDATVTVLAPLTESILIDLDVQLAQLSHGLRRRLEQQVPGPSSVAEVTTLDLRYTGQASELSLPVEAPVAQSVELLESRFHKWHAETYGHAGMGVVEVVRARLAALQKQPPVQISAEHGPPSANTRTVNFGDRDLDAPVLRRGDLRSGRRGPLLIDETDTTIVVPPGWSARITDGDIVLLDLATDNATEDST